MQLCELTYMTSKARYNDTTSKGTVVKDRGNRSKGGDTAMYSRVPPGEGSTSRWRGVGASQGQPSATKVSPYSPVKEPQKALSLLHYAVALRRRPKPLQG